MNLGILLPVRHSHFRKKIKNLVFPIDKMKAFRLQTDKMSTILAVFVANAGINAKKIGIRAVHTFSKRNADLGNGDVAGIA